MYKYVFYNQNNRELIFISTGSMSFPIKKGEEVVAKGVKFSVMNVTWVFNENDCTCEISLLPMHKV